MNTFVWAVLLACSTVAGTPETATGGLDKYIKPEPIESLAFTEYQNRLETRRDSAKRMVQQYNAGKLHVYPIATPLTNHQPLAKYLPRTVRADTRPLGGPNLLEKRWVFVPAHVGADGRFVPSRWRLITVPRR